MFTSAQGGGVEVRNAEYYVPPLFFEKAGGGGRGGGATKDDKGLFVTEYLRPWDGCRPPPSGGILATMIF